MSNNYTPIVDAEENTYSMDFWSMFMSEDEIAALMEKYREVEHTASSFVGIQLLHDEREELAKYKAAIEGTRAVGEILEKKACEAWEAISAYCKEKTGYVRTFSDNDSYEMAKLMECDDLSVRNHALKLYHDYILLHENQWACYHLRIIFNSCLRGEKPEKICSSLFPSRFPSLDNKSTGV